MLLAQCVMEYLTNQGYELAEPKPLPPLPSNTYRRYRRIVRYFGEPRTPQAHPSAKGRNAKRRAYKRAMIM
jgi:hypothetical protein